MLHAPNVYTGHTLQHDAEHLFFTDKAARFTLDIIYLQCIFFIYKKTFIYKK